MTIIEKYYDNGHITVQVDYTRTSSGSNRTDTYDEYETPFETEDQVNEFINDIDEKFKRLPDIR